MAIMIPDSCPARATAGEKRIYGLLRDDLPDDFTAWYEPVVKGHSPRLHPAGRLLRPAGPGGRGQVLHVR